MTAPWTIKEIEVLIRRFRANSWDGFDVDGLAAAIAAEHERRYEERVDATLRSNAELGISNVELRGQIDSLRARVAALTEALEGTVNHWVNGKPCWCPTKPWSDERTIPHGVCLDARAALAGTATEES